jgi:hypothetical protein
MPDLDTALNRKILRDHRLSLKGALRLGFRHFS